MASLLRKIVAGPRSRHPDADLDLCYVTSNIIATSGPSGTYPQRAYRNPLDGLTSFLNKKHKNNWTIWEFRAEGTGYPDEEIEKAGGKIWHFPWPDHHPPPFGLIPAIMGSMRDWLKGVDAEGNADEKLGEKRVVVVHCKAGKGRSGTVSCSYLISEEGWTKKDAVQRFTERRMRPGWGAGVSIPSQLRWLGYVERWKDGGKLYVERKVEVVEVHVWGLQGGVTVSVRGFVDEGKVIKVWHTFKADEREVVRGEVGEFGFADAVWEVIGSGPGTPSSETGSKTGTPINQSVDSLPKMKSSPALNIRKEQRDSTIQAEATTENRKIITPAQGNAAKNAETSATLASGSDAIFRPKTPITLTSNDINISTSRRTRGAYTWSVTTSISHVWFNTFFEGGGPENSGIAASSGVFEIEWDKMDGIKGSSKRGTKAFEKIDVVWRVVGGEKEEVIREPEVGEEVKQTGAADWTSSVKQAGPSGGVVEGESEAEGSEEEDLGTKPHVEK